MFYLNAHAAALRGGVLVLSLLCMMTPAQGQAESRVPTEKDLLEPLHGFVSTPVPRPRELLASWSDGASSLDEGVSDATESAAPFHLEQTYSFFQAWDSAEQSAGRELVDVDVRWDGVQARFTGIWHDTGGTVHRLIHGDSVQWSAFLADVGTRNGRWLDIEVGYFGTTKRWSGLFLEDGDFYNWAVHTTNSESGFQARLDQYSRDGRTIIDFEAYSDLSGATRFAGVWVDDPNQPRTHLYYHLELADVQDLLDPLAGRILDYERYFSSMHGGTRYALLVAQVPGGEWALDSNMTSSELASLDATHSDADTHLIDLDVFESGGVRYLGIWGNQWKSMWEVSAIPPDLDPEPITAGLLTEINTFESTAGTSGTLGFYAKNLRTDQSISYRGDELFYLASSAKMPIHIRFWQRIQDAHLSATTIFSYTNHSQTGSPWYVDERPAPGFGSGGFYKGTPTSNDLGSAVQLGRFDDAMMSVSDNGATSALVDDPGIGLSWDSLNLNEWLAGVAEVGQGFGLVTSIQDVDRIRFWQSQQDPAFSSAASYFLAPGHTFGPAGRRTYLACTQSEVEPATCVPASICTRCATDSQCPDETCNRIEDPWGDLRAFFGLASTAALPGRDFDIGEPRYFRMGLNSATPRAYGNLLEKYVEGGFHSPSTLTNSLNLTGEATSLNDNFPPGVVRVVSKAGSKGDNTQSTQVCAQTGVFQMGSDTVAMVALSKDNSRSCGLTGTIPLFGDIGRELLEALTPNLTSPPSSSVAFAPSSVRPGDTVSVIYSQQNAGGGDTPAFDVDIVLSNNTSITSGDPLLGTIRFNPQNGFATVPRAAAFSVPAVSPGIYNVGWLIDAQSEVSEWNELATDNNGYDTDGTLEVKAPLVAVENFRMTGSAAAAWDPVPDASNYHVLVGASVNLPRLLTGVEDSCRRSIASGPSTAGLLSTPPVGDFNWFLVVAEGVGPIAEASAGPRVVNSAGECGTSCNHSRCDIGPFLENACDPCVARVCEADSFCCSTSWDSLCRSEVRTVCNQAQCSDTQGACGHSVCAFGGALVPGCDDPPVSPSCVTAVCSADSFCCSSNWDTTCINEVPVYCGLSCE